MISYILKRYDTPERERDYLTNVSKWIEEKKQVASVTENNKKTGSCGELRLPTFRKDMTGRIMK